MDTVTLTIPTVRHSQCQLLLSPEMQAIRCSKCVRYRTTLSAQSRRMKESSAEESLSKCLTSSHTNYRQDRFTCVVRSYYLCSLYVCRYLSNSDLISRLKHLHHDHRLMSKQLERLKCKLSQIIERDGVSLDPELHGLLQETVKQEATAVLQVLPDTSFKSLFWKQQSEASRKRDSRGMRWYPLMIRWCLYLRYK